MKSRFGFSGLNCVKINLYYQEKPSELKTNSTISPENPAKFPKKREWLKKQWVLEKNGM